MPLPKPMTMPIPRQLLKALPSAPSATEGIGPRTIRAQPRPKGPLLLAATLAFGAPLSTGCESNCGAIQEGEDALDPFAGQQDIHLPLPGELTEALLPGDSATVDVEVQNVGGEVLTFTSVGLSSWSSSSWSFDSSTAPTSLDPGASATLVATFTSPFGAGLSAGALSFASDDPDEPEVAVPLVATSTGGTASLGLSDSYLDYGFQFRGTEVHKALTLSNEGQAELLITEVELQQGSGTTVFHLGCAGQAVDDCDWETTVAPSFLNSAIAGGEARTLDLVFAPDNLTAMSAQLTILSNDPQRPETTVLLRGNGEGALGCSPPTIEVTSPTGPAAFPTDGQLEITATVDDVDQPPELLVVKLYDGNTLIDDAFSSTGGVVEFDIDIDSHEDPNVVPQGLTSFTLEVSDSCPQMGYTTLVVAIGQDLAESDGDGDGWSVDDGDCFDLDSSRFPGNLEVQDGIDNDCDGTIDEGTPAWDNDCDGYCASDTTCLGQGPAANALDSCDGLADAPTGDCNDSTLATGGSTSTGSTTYPGADEEPDYLDNNCDGTVDEGTSLVDDDGDGQSENSGDCDDETANTFAGAFEWCDEVDNDCDGTTDEDCTHASFPAQVVGPIITSAYAVALGSSITAEVQVVAGDPPLAYTWSTDLGSFDGDANGALVTWKAPEDPELIGRYPSLAVEVTDSVGNRSNGFGTVYLADATSRSYSSGAGGSCGCAVGGADGAGPRGTGGLLWAVLLGLALAAPQRLRRKATSAARSEASAS